MKNKRNIIIAAALIVVLFAAGFLVGSYTKEKPAVKTFENAEKVTFEKDGGKISVDIPEGWEYVVDEDGLDNLSVVFSIDFKPEGVEGGYISLSFRESFGVCGTDLNTEEIAVGNYNAVMGTYGYANYWSYVKFLDTKGLYIANNDTAYWYYQYKDEVMAILSTVELD